MSIKSEHRRSCGHLAIVPREGRPPVKIWHYSMSLKMYARNCAAAGDLSALRWMGNKGMRIMARVHHGS